MIVLDYAAGWSAEMPRRTHSLLRYSQVTCVAFMACGGFILTGHEDGVVHVWNSFSLTVERKLAAHGGLVACLASPPAAPTAQSASGAPPRGLRTRSCSMRRR